MIINMSKKNRQNETLKKIIYGFIFAIFVVMVCGLGTVAVYLRTWKTYSFPDNSGSIRYPNNFTLVNPINDTQFSDGSWSFKEIQGSILNGNKGSVRLFITKAGSPTAGFDNYLSRSTEEGSVITSSGRMTVGNRESKYIDMGLNKYFFIQNKKDSYIIFSENIARQKQGVIINNIILRMMLMSIHFN